MLQAQPTQAGGGPGAAGQYTHRSNPASRRCLSPHSNTQRPFVARRQPAMPAQQQRVWGSRLLDHIDVILQRLPLWGGADQGWCATCHSG